MTSTNNAKITLYTNHACPFAQRAHITLKELQLPFEEVIIDLTKPREPFYLQINPRGTVPALKYSDKDVKETNITESAIVARFLAELKPSHLLPSANTSVSAVTRSRLAFFQDTWDTKIASHFYPTMLAAEADKEAKVKEWLGAIEKEIEPLLHDATPFFGGSQQLTMAEVHTGPFISRFHALSDGELIPVSLKQGLDALPNFGKWSRAVREHDIVKSTWDEPGVVASTKARINKMKADRK